MDFNNEYDVSLGMFILKYPSHTDASNDLDDQ